MNPPQPLITLDTNLRPYSAHLRQRWDNFAALLRLIDQQYGGLDKFTSLSERGLWVDSNNVLTFTEFAPGAVAVSLIGDFNDFDATANPMHPVSGKPGIWACTVPPNSRGLCAVATASEVAVHIVPSSSSAPLRRIPSQIFLATQTPGEVAYRGRMTRPPKPFPYSGLEGESSNRNRPPRPPIPNAERIYEAHIGASSGDPTAMGTFESFREKVLPRVADGGYTTIQLMGVAEHPFYPSFGYQVSNFFAASSRFGTVLDLINLIDDAHSRGIRVVMDIVQGHASTNVGEGLNRFDGTETAGYFKHHIHPEWGTRLFDFSQLEVVRFLLTNLRYWVERVGFDGFRFDAVTGILFQDHGLNRSFSGNYDEYFGSIVDEYAVTYLMMANHLLQQLAPGQLITIAEDVSGFPTLCRPVSEGGVGFSYRLALGHPDMWFDLLKEESDFDAQPLGFISKILSSLMSRRASLGEKTIAYVECHDQCIQGSSTSAQWLFAGDIYNCMSKFQQATPRVEMAMAWHKLFRMLTHTLGGEGYLNFMGNEFGHPEWLDLPAPHNHYSNEHGYRKWNLVDDTSLRFEQLRGFDKALNEREAKFGWLSSPPAKILLHEEAKRHLVFTRANLLFVFNLSADSIWTASIPASTPGKYNNELDSDEGWYGGQGRTSRDLVAISALRGAKHAAIIQNCSIPPRTGVIFSHS